MTPHRERQDLFFDRLLKAFLLVIALWLIILGIYNVRHQSDWAVGDWLVNYSGGFVRRGLLGQGALLLGRNHLSPLVSLLVVQDLLYAVLLWTVWSLARTARWSFWLAALLFSPATFAFVLLDPPFGFRKEILYFALLAISLRLLTPRANLSSGRGRSTLRVTVLLTIGCSVCVLSHEALLVFFPYLFAALWLGLKSFRRAALCFAIPAIVSVALFALVSHFPGNAHTSEAVCQSVGGVLTDPPSGICGGSIQYLGRDANYAHHQVVEEARKNHYAERMPWMILLALLPAALGIGLRWRDRRPEGQILLTCAAISWVLSVTVFYYGTDWTRWVYIHATSLCLLLVWLEGCFPASEAPHSVWHESRKRQAVAILLLLLYCSGWELTGYRQTFPYGGFVHFVRHNLVR